MRTYRGVVLLGLAFCVLGLSATAADDKAQLRDKIERLAAHVEKADRDIKAAFQSAGKTVPDQFTKAMKALRDETELWKEKLQGAADAAEVARGSQFHLRLNSACGALHQVVGGNVRLTQLPRSYSQVQDSKYFAMLQAHYQWYLDLAISTFAEVVEGKAREFRLAEADSVKEHNLSMILSTLSSRRSCEAMQTGENAVPKDNPVSLEYQVFFDTLPAKWDSALAAIDAWCAGTGPKPTDRDETRRIMEAVQRWDELVFTERERLSLSRQYATHVGSDVFRTYETAIKDAQATIRKLIDLSLRPDDVAKHKERESLNREREKQRQVCDAARQGLETANETAREKTVLDDLLKRHPELGKTEYPRRIREILAQMETAATAAREARMAEKPVEAAEAEGSLRLLQVRQELLRNEAEREAGFLAALRATESGKLSGKMSNRVARLRASMAELRDAAEKQAKARMLMQEMENRAELLQLKVDLMQKSVDALDEDVDRAEEKARDLADEIKEAADDADGEKDSKEAEKIPAESPVDRTPVRAPARR